MHIFPVQNVRGRRFHWFRNVPPVAAKTSRAQECAKSHYETRSVFVLWTCFLQCTEHKNSTIDGFKVEACMPLLMLCCWPEGPVLGILTIFLIANEWTWHILTSGYLNMGIRKGLVDKVLLLELWTLDCNKFAGYNFERVCLLLVQ